MIALLPTLPDEIAILPEKRDSFEMLVEATLATVAPSSARIYRETFRFWRTWCDKGNIDPLTLTAGNVKRYLVERTVSHSTRQRQLSALRKLARVLALDYTNPARQAAYQSLLLLRAPKEGATTKERDGRALSAAQTDKVLRVWDSEKPIHLRNKALIALLFLTGMRRAEAAALRWVDLDLDEGVIRIKHGKGDVARDVAIAGDAAIKGLIAWKNCLGDQREFVFCAVGKGDRLGPDTPMTPETVYYVIQQTEKLSEVTFSPHDARRTFITEALATGAPLADIQAQAGHKQESTTLRYAKSVDARHRRERLRLRYGG